LQPIARNLKPAGNPQASNHQAGKKRVAGKKMTNPQAETMSFAVHRESQKSYFLLSIKSENRIGNGYPSTHTLSPRLQRYQEIISPLFQIGRDGQWSPWIVVSM